MTTITAAQRRRILANAHAAWHATHANPQIDAVHNLKQALVQTNQMEYYDTIANVHFDGTTVVVTIYLGETIELDAYGNTLRGQE